MPLHATVQSVRLNRSLALFSFFISLACVRVSGNGSLALVNVYMCSFYWALSQNKNRKFSFLNGYASVATTYQCDNMRKWHPIHIDSKHFMDTRLRSVCDVRMGVCAVATFGPFGLKSKCEREKKRTYIIVYM